jgi:NAD(P)-dependent dehydrogenase (short-subunit alcohol dehydrogenase family)
MARRVVLISDPGRFAGPAAVRALAEDGATVVGCGADPDEPSGMEMADAREPEAIVAEVLAAHGQIDVLVNNDAFPAIRAPVEEARLEDLRASVEAMVVAPFALTQAVVPHFKERRRGKVVFVTSATPLRGLANYSMYVAARGAANALAVSLAKELARHGIQVNAVGPNYVRSPDYFTDEMVSDPDTLARIVRPIPLGRLGRPEELAALIAFLASDKADWITAQVIPFAGGWA